VRSRHEEDQRERALGERRRREQQRGAEPAPASRARTRLRAQRCVQEIEGAEQERREERIDALVAQQRERKQSGEVEARCEPAGVGAPEDARAQPLQEQHRQQQRDDVRRLLRNAGGGVRECHRGCNQPHRERRLVDVEPAIEMRRDPVATANHLECDRRVARVAVIERLGSEAQHERRDREAERGDEPRARREIATGSRAEISERSVPHRAHSTAITGPGATKSRAIHPRAELCRRIAPAVGDSDDTSTRGQEPGRTGRGDRIGSPQLAARCTRRSVRHRPGCHGARSIPTAP
jgi:hypothetical protein